MQDGGFRILDNTGHSEFPQIRQITTRTLRDAIYVICGQMMLSRRKSEIRNPKFQRRWVRQIKAPRISTAVSAPPTRNPSAIIVSAS